LNPLQSFQDFLFLDFQFHQRSLLSHSKDIIRIPAN
jgi:hypothetical protein